MMFPRFVLRRNVLCANILLNFKHIGTFYIIIYNDKGFAEGVRGSSNTIKIGSIKMRFYFCQYFHATILDKTCPNIELYHCKFGEFRT